MGSSFSSLFKRKTKVILLGLDAGGKTTILYKLKLGEVVTTIPTIGFNLETVEAKNVSISCWDVGGKDKIRPLWRHYLSDIDALIFVVDSNDTDRIEEARYELSKLLQEDQLRDAKLLVFANKQDLPNSMSKAEITERLGLIALRTREWNIQDAVATTGSGLYEGLEWVSRAQPVMTNGANARCPYKTGCYVVARETLDIWSRPAFKCDTGYRVKVQALPPLNNGEAVGHGDWIGSIPRDTHIQVVEVQDFGYCLGGVHGRIEEPVSGWVCLDERKTRAPEIIVSLHVVQQEKCNELSCINMAGEQLAKFDLDDPKETLMDLWLQIASRMEVQWRGLQLLSPNGRLLSEVDGALPISQALELPPQ